MDLDADTYVCACAVARVCLRASVSSSWRGVFLLLEASCPPGKGGSYDSEG